MKAITQFEKANLVNTCCHDSSVTNEAEALSEVDYWRRHFWMALVWSLPLFILVMGPMVFPDRLHALMAPWVRWVQFFLMLPILFWAGAPIWRRGLRSFSQRSLNMFSLIVVGVGGTFFYSCWQFFIPSSSSHHDLYFEAAAMIIVLVLLGQFLESLGRKKAGTALQELLEAVPTTAMLISADQEREVPVSSLHPGDVIRIHPGEKIPVDGVLIEGASFVEESILTGESLPVEKETGSLVHAGTLNGRGSFVMRVEQVGAATMLGQMREIVMRAQQHRAPVQKLADRIAAIIVPVIFVIAVMTFLVWYFLHPELGGAFALARALSVIMITCPCALGLATPLALTVGIGSAARQGVLVRDSIALEQLATATMIVFDKTGTLTEGKFEVVTLTRIFHGDSAAACESLMQTALDSGLGLGSMSNTAQRRNPRPPCLHHTALRLATNHREICGLKNCSTLPVEEWLSILVAAERGSEHPLGDAILRYAEAMKIEQKEVSFFEAVPGGGVHAVVDGKEVLVGSRKFLEEEKVDFGVWKDFFDHQKGSVVAVAVDHLLVGVVTLSDPLKPEAAEAVQKLKAAGLQVAMLTGDREFVASEVAKELGITTWKAGLSPQQKAKQLQEWQRTNQKIAMVGDGINDAPALSVANVSLAVHRGSNLAKETAGMILMKPSLTSILEAQAWSHRTMAVVRQNLFFAFIYNLLAVPLAAGLFYSSFGLLLNPMWATAAMSLSSLSVVGNSLRLKNLTL